VISVIVYHAKLTAFGIDWLKGGFVGVDIFFVVSGYLITRLILTELQNTNKFSFIKFYERRARRILPVLLLVIAVCIPFAWDKLMPLGLINFAKSALSAIGFGSNFFFYYSTTGYGTDEALLEPLLHTWSLSVEEQFYIVFPVVILLIWKLSRTSLLAILALLLCASIFIADTLATRNPELNFFFSFSRFWELLVGSVLAFVELNYGRPKTSLVSQIFALLGIGLIGHSAFSFETTAPHPSFQTLEPVVGAALIIVFCSKNDVVGKILSVKPMVGTGLISYSLYLWHFPIFAFSRLGTSTPSAYDKMEWIALTLIVSILSYIIIEKPFRDHNLLNSKQVFFSTVVMAIALSYFNLNLILNGGYAGRFPAWLTSTDKPWERLKQDGRQCFSRVEYPCLFINGKDLPTIITIGDSHFASIEHDLVSRFSDEFNFMTISLVGCPMFLGHSRYRVETNSPDKCSAEFQELRMSKIKSFDDPIVILYSRLPLYLTGSRFNNYENNLKNWGNEFRDNDGRTIDYQSAFLKTVKEITEVTKNLVVVSPTPEFGYNPAKRLLSDYANTDFRLNSDKKIDPISFDHEIYKNRVKSSFFLIDPVKSSVIFVDSSLVFCNSFIKDKCVASYGKELFFFDADHLSISGSRLLNNQIIRAIENNIDSTD